MSEKEVEIIRYYENELGWVPPFVEMFAKHAPGPLEGYMVMRRAVMEDPPKGALPRKTKEMLFSILDSVTGEANGAKAHARAAIAAGLTPEELAEGYAIAVIVTGITTMCKGGADSIRVAEEEQRKRKK